MFLVLLVVPPPNADISPFAISHIPNQQSIIKWQTCLERPQQQRRQDNEGGLTLQQS